MTRSDDWGTEGPAIVARSSAETVHVAVKCPCDRMARIADWGAEGPGIVARSSAETVNVAATCPCYGMARNDAGGLKALASQRVHPRILLMWQ